MSSAARAALLGKGPAGQTAGWRGFGAQVLLLTPPALLYFLVRDIAAGQESAAFTNAASIVELQRALGLDWEQTLQQQILDTPWLIDLMNWVYVYGHFPVLVTAIFVLFRFSRTNFLLLRNALVVSGAVGLLCFALYPVAPPRLFAPDLFYDSLSELSTSYQVLQNPNITNQFAAVPSFHVGWNLIIVAALVRACSRRSVRVLLGAVPVLMIASVVLTANHWLIDIGAGLAVALVGLCAGLAFERLLAPRLASRSNTTGSGPESDVLLAGSAPESISAAPVISTEPAESYAQ